MQLSSVFSWTDGSVSYTYFRNGWLKSQQTSKVRTDYTYTVRGNLLSLTNEDGSGNIISAFTGMLYNGAGQRTYAAINVPDVPGQLLGETATISYEYDLDGRLTHEVGTSTYAPATYDYHHS